MIAARQTEQTLLDADLALLWSEPLAIVPHAELRVQSRRARHVLGERRHCRFPLPAIWIAGRPYARACDLAAYLERTE